VIKAIIILGEAIALSILCEFLYWISYEHVVFNGETLTGAAYLYYLLPSFIVAFLCLSIIFFQKYIPEFLTNLLIVLLVTYATLCVMMLGEYCEPEKNLNLAYSTIIILILIAVAWSFLKIIIPRVHRKDRLVVTVAILITFVDFNYLLIGYRLMADLI
jgi:hypothetical protein